MNVTPITNNMPILNAPVVPVSQVTPVATNPVAPAPKADVVSFGQSEKSEKKGGFHPFQAINNAVGKVKKVFVTGSEYVKGAVKGTVIGSILGAAVYTASKAVNHFKGKNLPAALLGIVTGGLTLGFNLWRSSLNANEKRGDIDNRYKHNPV